MQQIENKKHVLTADALKETDSKQRQELPSLAPTLFTSLQFWSLANL